jgi:hypothetical protein
MSDDLGGVFRRTRRGYETRFGPPAATLLASLLGAVRARLQDSAPGPTGDPLDELIRPGGERLPDDAVLARLLPDGYRDDAGASAEFRRLTEGELRAAKIAAATTVIDQLANAADGRIVLDEAAAELWLTALNDLRLAYGTQLGVTEDIVDEFQTLNPGQDRWTQLLLYEWLGVMQDSLVNAVAG